MDFMRNIIRRLLGRRVVSAVLGVGVLIALIAGLIVLGAGADRRGDSTEFNERERPGTNVDLADGFAQWPMWGRTPARDRFDANASLHPPFRKIWNYRAKSLLEFPPAGDELYLYLGANDGKIHAIRKIDGTARWVTQTPGPIASTPVVVGNRLYVTEMDGALYVLDTETGSIDWTFKAKSRLESSPLVIGRRVYFGAHDGTVYAVSTRRHRAVWTYHADAPVKGALAYRSGRLYVGSYDGKLHAIRAGDGSGVWATPTRREFSFGGSLYSTPAVAYGRVYVGSTDGRVYSIGATSGKIIWVRSTGDWVYASPAVAEGRVFAGSYDGKMYAFDARTGDVLWDFNTGSSERISGSATVIGKIVYFSTLGGTTYGLDTATGKVRWTFADGRYSPIVSDVSRLFLAGYTKVYGFVAPSANSRANGATRAATS